LRIKKTNAKARIIGIKRSKVFLVVLVIGFNLLLQRLGA
jgi:hypothetical protein